MPVPALKTLNLLESIRVSPLEANVMALVKLFAFANSTMLNVNKFYYLLGYLGPFLVLTSSTTPQSFCS